jgi:hypothetical protein
VRILLDEGVPDIIKRRLTQFSIATVQELGWRGIKNGVLLDLIAGSFEVIIQQTRIYPFQQNLPKRRLAAIILPSNRMRIVKSLMPEIASAIETVREGETIELKPK